MEDIIISKHPYDEYVSSTITKLIIGSMPPYKFCKKENSNGKLIQEFDIQDDDVRWYYGSNRNKFWHLLGQVTNTELDFKNTEKAIKQRKKLLDKYNIGITDIVKTCIHKEGQKGKKSDDKSLEIIEYKKIDELLLKYKNINTLICTSEFVRKKLNQFASKRYRRSKDQKRIGKIEINDKEYTVITLYSPSPYALVGMGKEGPQKRLNQYKQIFK